MGIWPTDRFEGKRALVGGGTVGIGAAIAKAFAAEGAKVTVTGATEPEVAAFQEGADAKVLDVRDGFAGLSSPEDH